MIIKADSVVLRIPEPTDIEAFYAYKNDPEVAIMMGGFSKGYARADLKSWIEYHIQLVDETIWTIADGADDRCLGHVGLYEIDHRIRSAEFAIMLGDRTRWGQGLGKTITTTVLNYAFDMLNLNRVHLNLLENNLRALRLYKSLGFVEEGRLRQAQYKQGRYLNVVLMSLLSKEWNASR